MGSPAAPTAPTAFRRTDPITTSTAPTKRFVRRSDRVPTAPVRLGTHLIVVAALAASLVYIVWRWGFTLDGPSMWLGAPLAVAETYGLAMLALLAFSCWRIARREVPAPLTGREVAVLVATYNEPEDVLRPTVVGAKAIRNDIAPSVWVLDDGGRPWVRLMCEELGVNYLSRPAPRRHAKAGNINYALERVDAEFVVTLDADHVPRPELLERMSGYLADPRVAVVQAPQHFYNRGFQHPRDHDDPLRNEQSIFFDAILRGKDRHNAAFWCGCPSIVRRAAIASVGGVATDTVVEDAHTSMQLHAAGWKIVFHPEVMALGIAPEEIGAFLVQRGRWAKGSLQMLRHDPPMFKRGLTWSQRLEYMASCLHFLEGPQRLLGFLIPPIVLISGVAPIDAGPLLYACLFIPQILLVPLASRALTRGRYGLIEGERFAVARMTPYLKAMTALLGGKGGFQVTPKGGRARQVSVVGALWLPIVLASATVVAIAYQTAAQILGLPGQLSAGAHAITVIWAAANVALVVSVVVWARGVRHLRWSHRFPVAVQAGYAAGSGRADTPAQVEDISREGLSMLASTEHRRGERLRIVLLLDDGPVEVSGTVVRAGAGHDPGNWRIAVAFDGLEPAVADTIIEWCFRHPFGPDRPVRVTELEDDPRAEGAAAPMPAPEPSRA